MILYIDYRESWFIKKLQDLTDVPVDKMCTIKLGKDTLECMITNLQVGDFIIGNSLDTDVQLVIERKTYNDLASSIVDGRFRQQKDRITESVGDPSKILYILEGHKKKLCSRSKNMPAMINGAILNLIIKHQFKVLATESTDETFDTIFSIYKKWKALAQEKSSEISPETAPVKLVSKREAINNNLFATQLSAIPGVSYKIASLITEKYKNAKELIDDYTKSPAPFELLASLHISEKRKLGKALSKKIYIALCE